MTTTYVSQRLNLLFSRIATVSKRADYDLGALLEEIDAHEVRLDERCAASGGVATWNESDLVSLVMKAAVPALTAAMRSWLSSSRRIGPHCVTNRSDGPWRSTSGARTAPVR
jgi:hypothetical protein